MTIKYTKLDSVLMEITDDFGENTYYMRINDYGIPKIRWMWRNNNGNYEEVYEDKHKQLEGIFKERTLE